MKLDIATLFNRLCIVVIALATACIFAGPSNAQAGDDDTQQAIALFQQGQDLHEKGDLDGALRLYTRSLELLPDFPEAELQRGTIFVVQKNYTEAEKAFRRALSLRSDWTLAKVSLGSLLVTTGNYKEGQELLDETLEEDANNPVALAALADLLLRTGASRSDQMKLRDRLEAYAAKARPTAALLAAKAALELNLGDLAAARLSARRSLEVEPTRVLTLLLAAEIALREDDPMLAENYLARVTGASAASAEYITAKAAVAAAQGKTEQAQILLKSVPTGYEPAAKLLREINDTIIDDPKVWEERAAREPDSVKAHARLCGIYRTRDPVKALEACRRASVLEPNEISHAIGYGAALVQAKEFTAATELFRKLLTLMPEHATIRANLATALYQLKRYPEAKLEFRWLVQNKPDSPAAYYFLAIVHDQLGEYLEAMANYQQFLKLADGERDRLDIERVELRLPALQKLIKSGKGKRSSGGL